MRLNNGKYILIELRFKQGIDACKAIVKSHDEAIAKWTLGNSEIASKGTFDGLINRRYSY